jgi:hypothetical protein
MVYLPQVPVSFGFYRYRTFYAVLFPPKCTGTDTQHNQRGSMVLTRTDLFKTENHHKNWTKKSRMIPEPDADSIIHGGWDPAFCSESCVYDSRMICKCPGLMTADMTQIITFNIVLYVWFRFGNDIF